MKRLLSVVAILVLAASLLPVKSQAGLRGAFDFITGTGADPNVRGKFSPVLRGGIVTGTGTPASPTRERWIAFVALSAVSGSESVGEIHQVRNQDQSYARGNPDDIMFKDDTGAISYIDPAWSRDGKWLAYVVTDNHVNSASIYVQQFNTGTGTGTQKLGSPILIADGAGGQHHRHPAFNNAATQIAYDSDAGGPSIDIWTVDVALDATAHTGMVSEASRTRHALGMDANTLNSKAEFKVDYNPADNTKIAYVTNRFGVFQIQIGTLTADGNGESSINIEPNPALVTHDNPSWSENGQYIYYDAPASEDPTNPQDIWRLTLATGQKCNIFIDLAGDVDPDVSQYTNTTRDGLPYEFFTFISQANNIGVQVWLAESIQNCSPPLAVQVSASPSQIDITQGTESDVISTFITFPQSVRAFGYVCRAVNIGGEAMRFRRSIIASPTLMGLRSPATPDTGDCSGMDALAQLGEIPIDCATWVTPDFFTDVQGWWRVDLDPATVQPNHLVTMYWLRRTIQARIVALGLVNKYVPLTWRAYTNVTGRQLLGFAYLKLAKANYRAGSIVLEQNFPNPFNPTTNIKFAQDRPGNVEVRVFNVRGELVRTVANQWYPQGLHTVAWDGKTRTGGAAPSGVYYIRAKSLGGTDVIKAVLAK